MEYKNAHAWRVDFERKQQLILQKMREIVEEESKVLMDDVNAEYGAYEKEKITEVFQNAVTKFYNAYTPTLYEREGDTGSQTGGLYDMLSIAIDDEGRVILKTLSDIIDKDAAPTDRKDHSLYEKVFLGGWHGGAASISKRKEKKWGQHPSPNTSYTLADGSSLTGTPYYRTAGWVTLSKGQRVWHKWGAWGRKAERSTAPYKILKTDLQTALDGEMYQKLKEIGTKHNNAFFKKASERIQESIKDILT